MKKNVLLFIVMLYSTYTMACTCSNYGSLTVEELKDYKSIALVKVVEITEQYKPEDKKYYAYKIKVKTIEHYKGDTLIEIIVDGGHHKFNTWTSCDLGIQEGDEWIFLTRSYENNQHSVSYCDRNVRYRSAEGVRDWKYQRGFEELKLLDSVYFKTKNSQKDGQQIAYYSNGQKEVEEFYKNEQREGIRKIWYPNGKIWAEEFYEKGKLQGIAQWYNSEGAIESLAKYQGGLNVDTSFHFRKDLDDGKYKPEYLTIFDKEGHTLLSQTYVFSIKGLKDYSRYRLRQEDIYDWKNGIRTYTYYYENGAKYSSGQSRLKDYKNIGITKEWDKKGKLTKTWEYDENGKQISFKQY
jgi:antitoxin component YwqK of YwqJK toxin-antitoxin module